MENGGTEAIKLTSKNLEIVKKFVESAAYFANGILLTGSNAWGANYAVNKKSDVDILMVVNGIQELGEIIKCYVAKGLLNQNEQNRFEIFHNLSVQKRAEQFSVIADYSGTPISIDFFDIRTLKNITSLHSMKTVLNEGVDIRIVDEFRTNPPRPIGYSLDDLKSSRRVIYHPRFEEIKNDLGSTVGYLSETLVDGRSGSGDETTYFLGVMSFFLSINPVVLLDKDKQLITAIRTLQSNIATIIKAQIPAYITRQERMSADILKRIQNDLTA